LLGALVLTSGRARADERTEARGHFKKGMADIADGRYDAGIEELKAAYDILPHPNVLYNIARAYVDEGDIEDAVAYYKRYLEGDPKDRDEVAQIVTSLEARMRKQQAELLEAQQTAPLPAPPPTPIAPWVTGALPGPSSTAQPGPGGVSPPASVPPPGSVGAPGPPAAGERPREAPAAGMPEGSLRTEGVFEETVVTASRAAQSPLDAPNSTSIITEQDIRLSGITKIPELLRRLAGVDIMEVTGSQTEVSLRGFNQRLSNKVLVLVDGRSVYVDLLGATLWSTLSIGAEDIERIEVVRGPGSALYGADAFNGVINIITKTPGEGGSGFNAGFGDHDTTHGTVYVSGRDKETAYRLSAGYDYLPRWSEEVPPGRVDVRLTSSDQASSQRTVRMDGTVSRQLGRDVTVGLQGGFVQGTAELLGVGSINDILLDPFTSGSVRLFLNSKHLEVRTFFNTLRGDNGINSAYVGQSLLQGAFNLNVVDGEAQYIDNVHLTRGIDNDLHIGAAYRLKTVSWNFQARNETENHAGFFVHDEVKIGPRVAVVGDYRADYVPYLDRIVQSPRGSVLFHPTRQSTIRGTIATAFRTPTFLEAYLGLPLQLPLSGAAALIDQPSVKLNPEQIFTTEIGYLSSDSDYFTFDSAFFYNHATNLIDLAPLRSVTVGDLANAQVPTAASSETGLYPAFLANFENECQKFDVFGAEVGVRTFPLEGVDVYANTTLMDVVEDNHSCSSAQRALLATDARTSAVKANAGVQLRTRLGIDGSIDFHFVSPQTWAEQVEDLQRQTIVYQSFHLDSYTLLNASVGYRIWKTNAEIRLVAFNLLDDAHREHPFGQYIDRRLMALFAYQF
jgi:outer membrane receptor for ferrienterochelin and colicin